MILRSSFSTSEKKLFSFKAWKWNGNEAAYTCNVIVNMFCEHKHTEDQGWVGSVHAEGWNNNSLLLLQKQLMMMMKFWKPFCFCVLTAPPRNISLSVGETAVNLSWVTPERQRNIGFHVRYLRKNGKSFALSINKTVCFGEPLSFALTY